jgi:hypothetical protein
MFRLYLSHHQALKAQIHTVNNNENMYVTVHVVYNNRVSNRI